jgi:23S rRNA pseudouridine2605 synthase
VTLGDEVVRKANHVVQASELPTLRWRGKFVATNGTMSTGTDAVTRVFLVHKLKGERTTTKDPYNPKTLVGRLRRKGILKKMLEDAKGVRFKIIDRLDTQAEGLLLITTDMEYAREFESPDLALHQQYRIRCRGEVTEQKIEALRRGVHVHRKRSYPPMLLRYTPKPERQFLETYYWLTVTANTGNDQLIRDAFKHQGCKYLYSVCGFFWQVWYES